MFGIAPFGHPRAALLPPIRIIASASLQNRNGRGFVSACASARKLLFEGKMKSQSDLHNFLRNRRLIGSGPYKLNATFGKTPPKLLKGRVRCPAGLGRP